MEYKNVWVDNNGTNIHFIDSNFDAKQELPLVIIPGLSESAEDYLPLLKTLPRRCIALTLRGRGNSDAPQKGYTLEDHISDIEVVIKHLGLNQFILMGFSRGVTYSIGYALNNSDSIKGLILGDYPAYHSQLPSEWVEFFSSLPPWRGKSLSERMKPHVLNELQTDSKQVLFWDKLSSIQCPVLVIRGGKQGAALSIDDGKKYLEKIPNVNLVVFEESDHNIFEPNFEKFINTVELFFKTIKS
ncbi:alpha/beta fold hydrolase [Paenisporosarcina sp. TG-14]|uniref:alpha/beta fold hydrolase n=1 Tax=Paenisporosarcina sp. TG-14 TaxID=1231057 RepID=UPI00031160D2|nr:alpha/beta hydrolase [Paenisporosarcina sp. TG-14]